MKREFFTDIDDKDLGEIISSESGHSCENCLSSELIIRLIEPIFPRGWRWRPDNSLLICYYADYDTPYLQFQGDNFVRLASFAYLSHKGWTIKQTIKNEN